MESSEAAINWAKVAVGLSATALAVSLLGIAPASAVNTVKRALFAKNAGAVDGISASRTPKAGQLLPLDAEGRLPGSVLPSSGAGLRGPRGAQGPAGPRGPATAFATHASPGIPMIRAAWAYTTVSKLERVPAGKWVLMFSLQGTWFDAGAVVLACKLVADGTEVTRKEVVIGTAGASRALSIAGSAAVDRPEPFTVTTECATSDAVLPDTRDAVGIAGRDLTAIRVEELTTQ